MHVDVRTADAQLQILQSCILHAPRSEGSQATENINK